MNPTRIMAAWARLGGTVLGRLIFSFLLGWVVPYSGSIGARVTRFAPGACELQLPDRRRVHNHLNSIHAIALINLAELASGLAMLSGLPPTARGIVTHIEMDYEKKARGLLTVRSTARTPGIIDKDMEHTVEAEIFDLSGDRVAIGRIIWRLGPKPEASA